MKYRSPNQENDWNFYVPDCPVSAACLSQIHPLTEASANELWREFISSDIFHPMQLSGDFWPTDSGIFARWDDDWHDDSSTAFVSWLRAALPWPDATPIIFTWSASSSVETSWAVFCECWRNFLFDDEGPLLWSLEQAQAVQFSPQGLAYLCRRA
ncbi:MAG: DUF2947 domain-containing protein [Proteobacteria bacterium]|nr:DUF2947 domain-containing protein [Pseudomonadota bacterium]